ncbi:uncharacterized protein EAE97_004807 [Botrytis byssoidea]|uniref:Uncharacterized protein n=1 Tax=Botrytis byssoidea TaxID=139641 RepID=A0A9P5LVJ7_9HELO|nr:uncharacterized protein EAE97_004807 [Botrytis byssoidea]KAF7945769.1 hypothetical protein EAE97_004807 [Botrytis byssoidea]
MHSTPDYFLDAGSNGDVEKNRDIENNSDIEKNRDIENTRNNAIKVLEGMDKIISQKKKTSEKYCIDISQIYSSRLRSSASQINRGVDLIHNFEQIYREYTPLPGLSIGREEHDTAGSLTGFLRHDDDIYSLTCRHVVFPYKNFRSEYKHQNGEEKLQVSIPAMKDHVETKGRLKFALDNITFGNKNVRFEDAANIDEEYMLHIETQEIHRKSSLIRYNAAEDYCPIAGYVSAAPEEWRKAPGYTGNLDWAIIKNLCIGISNILPRSRFWPTDECKASNSKCQVLQDSERFNIKHPSSSLALGTNKFYFKAPSRTLGWLACEMNGIRSIHHENGHGCSEECVFVGAMNGEAVSGGGDSGSLIYDIDIDTTDADKPTAALIPMAMIWGGNDGGSIISGFGDVTYATPIGAVLKDIECEMGWDEGSLEFC